RGLVRCGNATLADPGTRPDPLVIRVDHPLEIGVRQDLGGRVPPPAGHVRMARGAHRGSTSINGCLALTSAPLSATTLTTRPARSDLISLNSFIASMRPMTWPTATSPPTCTYGAEPGAGEPYQTPVSGALTDGRLGTADAAEPAVDSLPAAGGDASLAAPGPLAA